MSRICCSPSSSLESGYDSHEHDDDGMFTIGESFSSSPPPRCANKPSGLVRAKSGIALAFAEQHNDQHQRQRQRSSLTCSDSSMPMLSERSNSISSCGSYTSMSSSATAPSDSAVLSLGEGEPVELRNCHNCRVLFPFCTSAGENAPEFCSGECRLSLSIRAEAQRVKKQAMLQRQRASRYVRYENYNNNDHMASEQYCGQ